MAASFEGGDGQECVMENGLVATHVYSIIRLCPYVIHNKKKRFIELRNPWGNSVEWKGAWNDHDPAWKENPHLAKELDHKEADDGTFWMLFDDFVKEYTTVFVCPASKGEECPEMVSTKSEGVTDYGQWLDASMGTDNKEALRKATVSADHPGHWESKPLTLEVEQAPRSRPTEDEQEAGGCADKCCAVM